MSYLRFMSILFLPLAKLINHLPKAVWRYFCLGSKATVADIIWIKTALSQVNPAVIAHRLKLVALQKPVACSPITIPAFYLQASEDRLVPQNAAESLSALFEQFTLWRVQGPHFLLQASPIECAIIIKNIIDNHT